MRWFALKITVQEDLLMNLLLKKGQRKRTVVFLLRTHGNWSKNLPHNQNRRKFMGSRTERALEHSNYDDFFQLNSDIAPFLLVFFYFEAVFFIGQIRCAAVSVYQETRILKTHCTSRRLSKSSSFFLWRFLYFMSIDWTKLLMKRKLIRNEQEWKKTTHLLILNQLRIDRSK